MTVGRKITNGILSGAVLTLISIAVAFLQFRLVVQYLPKDVAGIWFLFVTFGGYIIFFDLGVGPTVGREISFIIGKTKDNELKKQTEIAALVATCVRIFYVLATAVFVIGLIGGLLFLATVTRTEILPEVRIAWFVFVLGASLNLLGSASFATLYGLGNISAERIIRAFTQLLGLGLCTAALQLGFGLLGLACAWALQGVTARIVGWIVLRRTYPHLRVPSQPSMALLHRIAVPSLKWAATALGGILILQTDNVIIAAVIGPAAIPAYEAVAKIAITLMTFSMLIVTSSTPFLSQAFASNDFQRFRTLLYRNVRISVSTVIILGSFFSFFADRIINVWLGPGNFIGFPTVWVLSTMLLLEVHHVTLATAAMATGKRFFVTVALVAGVLNIGISWILAQKFGLLGVAFGTLIAQLLTNNWYVSYISLRLLKIPFADYSARVLLPIGGMLFVSLGANGFARHYLKDANDLFAIFFGFTIVVLICIPFLAIPLITRKKFSQ